MWNAILIKLVGLLWDRLQPLIIEELKKYAPLIAERLMALLPVIVAAATKQFTDHLQLALADKMHDVPVIGDVMDIAEKVREDVNVSIPDIDIPVLSDIFDLTEWFNKHI